MSELTYKKAGVDIDEGERFVEMIAPMVKSTKRKEVLSGLGSFSAFFRLDTGKYKDPVLVSGTDGVGTKLRVAFMAGRHDTVGIDLVAMCVNDILTSGAEPLFFLDYFATGSLKAEDAAKVIAGIVEGCKQAGCALVGGETAEMPGFYTGGEYDLSGFSVGAVESGCIVDGSGIEEGDELVGISSNGLHSNGYSLVRKVFFEKRKMGVDDFVEEFGSTLGEELLRPTRIYAKALGLLGPLGRLGADDKGLEGVRIKGMAHITGGGIPGNVPRMLPEGLCAEIEEKSWPVPPVFRIIKDYGNIPVDDMRRTFNMGIGYVIAVNNGSSNKVLETFNENGYDAYRIGWITKGKRGTNYLNG